MAKIKIKTHLKSTDEIINKNLYGIINDSKITYKDDDINVTLLLNKDEVVLKRMGKEYEIILNFNSKSLTKGTYILKDYNKCLDLSVKTKECTYNDNHLFIKYHLFSNDELIDEYEFRLDYEVI